MMPVMREKERAGPDQNQDERKGYDRPDGWQGAVVLAVICVLSSIFIPSNTVRFVIRCRVAILVCNAIHLTRMSGIVIRPIDEGRPLSSLVCCRIFAPYVMESTRLSQRQTGRAKRNGG